MAAKGNNLTPRRREMEVAEKVRLADVVDINTSSPPNYEGVKRYISTGAIVDGAIVESQVEMFGFSERPSRADLYPKEGDVLFAKMQATRKTFVVDRMNSGSLYSTGFYALTPHKDEIDTLYLSHYLDSEQFSSAKDKECNGATQKALSGVGFKKLLVPLPPLPAQRRIAAELDKICELKKNAETRIEKLDLLVKSRFVEMFGDPFSNPMGWPSKTFKEAGERLSDGPFGSNLKSSHYSDSGVRVIRLGNIGVGKFIDDDRAFIPKEHYEMLKKYTCHAGEIVIGTLGDPNLRACLIPENIDVAVNKSDCVHYLPKKNLLDKQYVCWYLNSPGTLKLAASMIHGQTRSRVSSVQIAKMPICIPPLALQREFAAFVVKVDKLRENVRATVVKMDVLYRSKLQECFG